MGQSQHTREQSKQTQSRCRTPGRRPDMKANMAVRTTRNPTSLTLGSQQSPSNAPNRQVQASRKYAFLPGCEAGPDAPTAASARPAPGRLQEGSKDAWPYERNHRVRSRPASELMDFRPIHGHLLLGLGQRGAGPKLSVAGQKAQPLGNFVEGSASLRLSMTMPSSSIGKNPRVDCRPPDSSTN